MTETPLLAVRNLSLGVQRKGRATTVIVDDISFDVAEGERFGIVTDVVYTLLDPRVDLSNTEAAR